MGSLSSNNLILSGIIVGAILSAGISFLKFIANEQVSVVIFWLMGSFASKTWFEFFIVIIFLLTDFAVSMFSAKDIIMIGCHPYIPRFSQPSMEDFEKVENII